MLSVVFLLFFKFSWADTVPDSLKLNRYKTHISSLDYISRQTDNGKYFLNLANNYTDSVLAIDPANNFALDFKNKISLTLATCDRNMNHKVELFPFFNGFPDYMGFADDPIEYAYDDAIKKLLSSKYIKVQNGPISQTNITSIIVRDNCDDEMFEIVNQILIKNTNHYILPFHEIEEILGKSEALNVVNGNLNDANISLLCDQLKLDRIGIFRVNDIDVINNSIWLVGSDFSTFIKSAGFSEPIAARGFCLDKRSISFLYILLLLLKSILLIAFVSFLNQKLGRIFKSSDTVIKDLVKLYIKKVEFVAVCSVVPLIFSFLLIYFLSYLTPSPEDDFLEFSSKTWLLLITLGMSVVPTILNLFFVNRINLDGFHTIKGYRYFANTSLYSTYFPLFVFFIIQFDYYPIYSHFLLIGITLIIGDLLARSYFQYSSKSNNTSLKKQAAIGITLGVIGLLIFNAIILGKLSVENLLISGLIIAPLSVLHYILSNVINKKYESQLKESSQNNLLNDIPFIKNVLDPEEDIYRKVINSTSATELDIMVLSGPAGIGKTRSLKEVKSFFSKNKWDWYYGDCDEVQAEGAVTFEPFLEAFKSLLKIDEFTNRADSIEATVGAAVSAGASILDLDSLLPSEYQKNEEKSISEICIEIIDTLENRKNKTVFVMEDLHWIDPESYAFLKLFVKMISRNKFLRGNMCIILSIRDKTLLDVRGPSFSELMTDLNNLNTNATFKFSINELLTIKNFNVLNFTKHLSNQNNQFRIQNSSLLEINDLFNKGMDSNKTYSLITPLYILKVIEKWIHDGVLKYSPSGYLLTSGIDSDSLPNNSEVDGYYHSIIDTYDEKWKRLLESASIIGSKFSAEILAQVWKFELLEVLGFLEKAVRDNLLVDISQEDNLYKFKDKRIISAIKSYFSQADDGGDKQIVLEYNKRYIQTQESIIEMPHLHSVEEILSVIRRLMMLLINDSYRQVAEKLIFEVVVRLVDNGENDKLSAFNDFLIKTNKLKGLVQIISAIIRINNKDISVSQIEKLEKAIFELKLAEGSASSDLRIYALLLTPMIMGGRKNSDKTVRISQSDLESINTKIMNDFNGIVQFKTRLLYIDYTYSNVKKTQGELLVLRKIIGDGNLNFKLWLGHYDLKYMAWETIVDVASIDTKSTELLDEVKLTNDLKLKEEILKYRLRFISNTLNNDEKAIAEFRANHAILLNSSGISAHWVSLVLSFIVGFSGKIYFKKYPEEATENFNLCEAYLKKFIDFNIWNTWVHELVDAKQIYLIFIKDYTALEQLCLTHLKLIEDSLGKSSYQAHEACASLADTYNYMDDVELGLKYRLAAIDSILTLKPDDLSSSERLNTLKKYQLQALATSYSNLSGFYRNKLADGAKAVDYAQKALEIKKHFGKNQKYGISLFQLARAHELNKDYAKAIDCFNQALPLFSELSEKDIYQKLVLTISLGISLSFVDSKKAKAVLKESLGKMANDTMSVYLNKGDEDRMILAKNILKKL